MYDDVKTRAKNHICKQSSFSIFIHPYYHSGVAIKISNLNFLCSFELSCPILEKDNLIKLLYIVFVSFIF